MRFDFNIRKIEVKALHTTMHYRLNGNMKIFPINLKTASSVKPTILKGSRISQSRGNKNSMSNASGQDTTSNKHQRARAINILIAINKTPFLGCLSVNSAYTIARQTSSK
jgi:hypothetical protein